MFHQLVAHGVHLWDVQLNILVEPKTPEEADPYAAYQIPDDLMW